MNIGDRVRVTGYPFHGYVGTVLRVGELDVRVQLDAGPVLWLSPGELEVIPAESPSPRTSWIKRGGEFTSGGDPRWN